MGTVYKFYKYDIIKLSQTAAIREDQGSVQLTAVNDGSEMQLSWKPQGNNSLKLVYVDQFGTKNEVNLQSGVTDYTLSDLKAGFRYEFSLVVTDEATGDVFSGSASGNIPSPGH